MVKGLKLDLNRHQAQVHAMGGATIPDLIRVCGAWTRDLDIETISILVGTNDISTSHGILEICHKYLGLIDVLRYRFPYASIHCVSVLPRFDRPELASRIVRFNQMMRGVICDYFGSNYEMNVGWYECLGDFLEHCGCCVNRSLFGRGMLHPSAHGKRHLVNIFKYLMS